MSNDEEVEIKTLRELVERLKKENAELKEKLEALLGPRPKGDK